jgi:hypothetical protein
MRLHTDPLFCGIHQTTNNPMAVYMLHNISSQTYHDTAWSKQFDRKLRHNATNGVEYNVELSACSQPIAVLKIKSCDGTLLQHKVLLLQRARCRHGSTCSSTHLQGKVTDPPSSCRMNE